MIKLLISFIFSLGLIVTSITASATTPNHCTEDEEILFNCLIEGSKKIASVCGNNFFQKGIGGAGYIQYRFGRIGKIEFEYPWNRSWDNLLNKFRADRGRAADFSFSDSFFDFQNEGFVYEIWYREERQKNGSDSRSAGIATWKTGDRGKAGKTKEFICKNTSDKDIELYMRDIVGNFSSPGFRYWELLQ